MKLMHISDLHLGKRVNEFSMIEDQKYILTQIIGILEDEQPDGLLVAGDVFDKSVPSEDAVKLWDDFLNAVSGHNIPVFAISGNHDSAVRFASHNALVEQAGVYLSPVYDGTVKSYQLMDEYGELNIYLLPFVKPFLVRSIYPEEMVNDYTDACRIAIDHMEVDSTKRNIIVAHQFVTGATTCDSEELSIGGLDQVDVSVFDAFDYVALGHIHGPQKIKRETVRYCGTPLKYSFSEKHHKKAVTIVEVCEKGTVQVRECALTPLRDLREVKGTYEELTNRSNYEGTNLEDYMHIILTDEEDVYDAIGKLRIIYPNLMKLSYDNKRTRENRQIERVEEIENKTPLALFEELYEQQNNQVMTEEQKQFTQKLIEKLQGV